MSRKRFVSRFGLLFALFLLLTGSSLYAQSTASCEAGFRPFTHAMGESCIPENPQRVVVLDTGELDNALALGAPIVGAPTTDAVQYQAYLADQLDGIADTGTISEPNFEAILALAPDLILGSKQRYEAIYEQLTQIAPTVFTESLRVPWQQNFNFHADALGKTVEAEELIAAYDAHVADLQTELGDALETTTISILRFRPGQVRLYLKSSYIGYILQDVGLKRPTSQDEDIFSAEISLEEVQAVDADYIFVTGYDVEDSERDTFLNSPLWQTLTAVQNGHVVDINDDTWIAGLGVQAANLVLDDLATLLVGDSQAAAYPITIEHKFGSTIITEKPERVVALGFAEQDALLALGVVPVASRYWFGDETDNVFPWAEDEAKGAQPEVLNMTFGSLNYEAILALNPDVITATDSGITQEEYDQLSQIAPTIAQLDTYIDFGMPWYETTRLLAKVFDKTEEAEVLISEVEGLFEDVRAANTEFAGKTVVVAYNYGTNRTYGFYTDQDIRGRFFSDLGFVIPEELVTIAGDSYYADLSLERIDLFNQDLLVFVGMQFTDGGQAAVEADPIISQLDVVKDGRVLYIPAEFDDALNYSTILSLEYALEGVVPELQKVLGTSSS